MPNLIRDIIHRTLSVRISMMVVCAIAVLLITSTGLVLFFSYKVIKQDSRLTTGEALEYTTQYIDNILLSVEQSSGNLYWDILMHLKEPQRMHTYTRRMVEGNSYITGCAIALKPHYNEQYTCDSLFMSYHYRSVDDEGHETIVRSNQFGSTDYNHQTWYQKPMKTGAPCWVDPISNRTRENEAVTTYSLPLYDASRQVVGVLAVDVSIVLLSQIIQKAKPTPNSYAVLIDSMGAFIVSPDTGLLLHHNVFSEQYNQADTTVKKVSLAMRAGKTGYSTIHTSRGDCYVYYKPFRRSADIWRVQQDMKWSVAVIYPEDDIIGDFRHMCYVVIAFVCIGLVVLFILCRCFTHRQLLPLRLLTRSAQRIAQGHYDETIPPSRHINEIGSLQNNFRQMQVSLAGNISQMRQLSASLQERGKRLEEALEQAQEAERMKTAVLHNMTNQMLPPVNAIEQSVEALCNGYSTITDDDAARHSQTIQQNGKTVTSLLDELLKASQAKEKHHDNH